MFICRPYGDGYARLITFQSRESDAFTMELTDHHLRLISGNSLLVQNDNGTPVYITDGSGPLTTSANHGFSVNDQILLFFPVGFDIADMPIVQNGIFTVTSTPALNKVTLSDPLGNDLTGSGVVGIALRKILNITTPYTTAQLPTLRSVQASTEAILLHSGVKPYVLTECPSFALAAVPFVDGPYLDPQPMFTTVTGYSGANTLTAASAAFAATDTSGTGGTGTFNRHVRLYTEPPPYALLTTYAAGDLVTYQGSFWQSIIAGNLGAAPNGYPQFWAPAVNVQSWAWGTITGYTSSTVVTVTLQTPLNSANGSTVAAGNWLLGVYSSTTSFPTCGTYHEGRLWLGGAVENRFDGSMANELFTFSPTDPYGNVADDHAISETLNSDDLNQIYWMTPDHQGILCGTLGGEFLIEATAANDVLTPTSIQAHRVTKYGCANIEPRRAGMAMIFVQRYQQRLMEYLTDAFTGRFSGLHINSKAKHIATTGIAEIAYMEELAPIIWCRMNDGSLAGVTYRRNSRFVSEAPVFSAWWRVQHGGDRSVESICVTPSPGGLDDRLYLSTTDAFGIRNIEWMRPLFRETDTLSGGPL